MDIFFYFGLLPFIIYLAVFTFVRRRQFVYSSRAACNYKKARLNNYYFMVAINHVCFEILQKKSLKAVMQLT